MAKEVITVEGEDVIVRSDTAKAFRAVRWMVLSLAAFILIMLVLIFAGLIDLNTENTPSTVPAENAPERSVP
ncbi:MAG: hypothetical protein KF685_03945 [Acidobacteria bacterium]|nr:hypothetical protein [Acidobacteriota bacterium]